MVLKVTGEGNSLVIYINIGTGMVTIALASLIIGQTLIGNKGSTIRRILGISALVCWAIVVVPWIILPAGDRLA